MKASRARRPGSGRASSSGSSSGLRNASRKTASISVCVALPPAPCDRVIRSSLTRGAGAPGPVDPLEHLLLAAVPGSGCGEPAPSVPRPGRARAASAPGSSARGRPAAREVAPRARAGPRPPMIALPVMAAVTPSPAPGEPAEVVVGGAGALGRDHAGADRRLRRAGGAEHLALPRLEHALEHLAALAGLRVGDPDTRAPRRAARRRRLRNSRGPQRRVRDEARGRATRSTAAAPSPRRSPVSAARLPSHGTTRRVLVLDLAAALGQLQHQHVDRLQDVQRLEPGARPAACRSSLAMNSYGRQPITVDTCPGPMKPSSRRSGESRMALMAGMIVTWLQKTEKFSSPSPRPRAARSSRWTGRWSRSRWP